MTSVGFTPVNVTSEDKLYLLLNQFPNIKPKTWVKDVSALFKEIDNGECILGIEDGKLYRRVDEAVIKCFYTNKVGQRFQIFEEKQVFNDGTVRKRDNPYVAEKLQEGETPEEGAKRGLAEELKISGPDVNVTPLPKENKIERKESPTYIGIQSIYNNFVFSYEMSEKHYKDAYVEEQEDKKTFFSWIKI